MDQPGKTGSLYVKADELAGSRHSRMACVQCHTGGTPSNPRACITIPEKVDCNICHEKVAAQYQESIHGTLAAEGSPDAPLCQDCHGTHGTLGKHDPNSPTFSRNVPTLCANATRPGTRRPSATRASRIISWNATARASTAPACCRPD